MRGSAQPRAALEAAPPWKLPCQSLPRCLSGDNTLLDAASLVSSPAVDDKQRFTLYWLECSLLAGAPLPASRGAPLYQPLPYPLPVPSMQGVV